MINLIMGRPGGGKSYEAVTYHILPALKDKRKVITNMPLNLDIIEKVLGSEAVKLITIIKTDLHDYGNADRPFSVPEHYKDDWRNEKGQGALVVVDECHMVMPCRGTKTELLEFLSMHRHFGIDILLITQSHKKIHRDIRDMIEIVYQCIKATALGSNKHYIKKVRMGVGGDVTNTETRNYNKSYFKFYQSHTASNSAVQEATAKDVKPLWKSKIFIALYVSLIFSVWAFWNLFDTYSEPEPEPVSKTVQAVESVPVPVPVVRPKGVVHPMKDLKLVPTGYAFQLEYQDGAIAVTDGTFLKIFFEVKEGKKVLFKTDSIALSKSGYSVTEISDCFYDISYKGSHLEYAACHIKDPFEEKEVPTLLDNFNPLG